MKRIFIFFILCTISLPSIARNNIAVGFGQPYGGFLGVKFSHIENKNKFYASIGSYGPIGEGFGVGIDHAILNKNHSIGIFYGVVAGQSNTFESTRYIGPMLNYQFYTSSFSESSWVFGFGAGYGEADKHENNSKYGSSILFHIGYQF